MQDEGFAKNDGREGIVNGRWIAKFNIIPFQKLKIWITIKKTIFYILTFLFILQGHSFAEDIAISGSDAPTNGSQYNATGGTVPYTWTISKGSITQDGIVTVAGQCGGATITVTDSLTLLEHRI